MTRVAYGLKAHSGWAALVVLGADDGGYHVVDRRRIELVEENAPSGARQPYHAAEKLPPAETRERVKRGIDGARRAAANEIRTAVKQSKDSGHDVAACAVLMPEPMPDWSTEEILAVHFRMHKAEGVLFPDALVRAARACGLRVVQVREKVLWETAEAELAAGRGALAPKLAALGKAAGPPWGKDQKCAALAAMIALKGMHGDS